MMKRKFQYSIPVLFRRLFHMAAPVRHYIAGATVASVLGNMAHIGLMGFGSAYLLCMGGYLSGPAVAYAVLALISAVLIPTGRYFEGIISHVGSYKLLAQMRVDLFDAIRRLAPACLEDREKGDLMNIAISDIETIEFFFAHTIGPMFTVILLPVTTLIIAASFHPLYALVLAPIYIIISVVIPLIGMKAGRNIGMTYRESLADMKSFILESVYGIKDIQIFDQGETRKQQADEKNRTVNRAAHRLTLFRQTISTAPTFFVYTARILVLLAATSLVGQKTGTSAEAVLISFIAMASFSSTFSLTTVVSSLLEAFASAERIFIIEDTEPEIIDPPDPDTMGPVETIRWDDVSFRYPNTETDILRHFHYEIKKGEKIGISGPSGSGKSTILKLLMAFYRPTSGRLLLNEKPIETLSTKELHQHLAVLEQETFLTSGTLAENIALGRPGASLDEIRAAAKRAGLADLIETLPLGYDTPMGEMGDRLSGGEKQRVGIARIMLLDPDVIVMDEPTSSLDVFHEKELLDTLSREYADKTVLMISHRPSTLTDCTRILKVRSE